MPSCSNGAMPSDVEIRRRASSGSKSVTVLPSSTRPWRGIVPVTKSSASVSDVLPAPPWPTRATLRSLSVGYVLAGTATPTFDVSLARVYVGARDVRLGTRFRQGAVVPSVDARRTLARQGRARTGASRQRSAPRRDQRRRPHHLRARDRGRHRVRHRRRAPRARRDRRDPHRRARHPRRVGRPHQRSGRSPRRVLRLRVRPRRRRRALPRCRLVPRRTRTRACRCW